MKLLLLVLFAGTLAGLDVQGDYNRAWLLIGQSKADEAIPILKGIIGACPSFYRAYDQLVEAYGVKNDLPSAREYLGSLRRTGADGAYVLYGLGSVSEAGHDVLQAQRYSIECAQVRPTWRPCYERIARIPPHEDGTALVFLRHMVESYPTALAVHYGLGKYLEERQHWEAALGEQVIALHCLSRADKRDDDSEYAVRLAIARIWVERGEFERAEEELSRIDLLSRGDSERELLTLQAGAGWLRIAGRYPEAIERLKGAIARARMMGQVQYTMAALGNVARALAETGRVDEAAAYHLEAVRLAGEYGRTEDAYGHLEDLSELAISRGELKQALEYLNQARRASELVNNDGKLGLALRAIGTVYLLLGDYGRGLDYHLRSVRTFQQSRQRDFSWQAGCGVGLIGTIYERLGDFRKALQNYTYSLRSAERFNDPEEMQRNLIALGSLYERTNRLNLAVESLERVLALSARTHNEPYRIQALINLGVTEGKVGQFAAALARLGEARKEARRLRIGPMEARALNGLGRCHLDRGDMDAASSSWKMVLAMSEPAGIQEMIWPARAGLGEIAMRQGRLKDAAVELRSAVATIESVRSQAGKPSLKVHFLQDKVTVYERLIEVLSRLHGKHPSAGYDREAFDYAERGRTRSFLETLASAQSTADAGQPYGASAIQTELARRGGALLEYTLGERESVAWLVTGRTLVMKRLPARAAIGQAVKVYRTLIAQRPRVVASGGAAEEDARRLYAMLLQPFARELADAEELTIVPDGMLHYLPFETLLAETSDRRFGEVRTITYAPSASVLAELEHRPATPASGHWGELVAFGDPQFHNGSTDLRRATDVAGMVRAAYQKQGLSLSPLPNSRREVQEIAAFFPESAKVYLGAQATKAAVQAEAATGYRRMHFATHALVDERAPWRSGLALTPNGSDDDGILRVSDVLKLKLDTDIVVLSACQTGLGALVRGEGMMGLTRAFLGAGASRLVVSLWEVNDVATATFMKHFYRNLKSGLPPARALQEAKIAMMHSDVVAYRHPYFWAPFVLVGAT